MNFQVVSRVTPSKRPVDLVLHSVSTAIRDPENTRELARLAEPVFTFITRPSTALLTTLSELLN